MGFHGLGCFPAGGVALAAGGIDATTLSTPTDGSAAALDVDADCREILSCVRHIGHFLALESLRVLLPLL